MTPCKSCEYSQRQIEKLQREVESLTKELDLQKALLERESEVIGSVCECKVCGKPFGDRLSLYEHYDEEHNRQTDR
jgi:hypothetical protein